MIARILFHPYTTDLLTLCGLVLLTKPQEVAP